MRVFLTGATGFVGSNLRQALVREGHQVVGIARRSPPEEAGITWVVGDIADVAALLEGMDGCQAVIHLVGIIREARGATFHDVHVAGTEHVLAAMRQLRIKRLIHMSALGAGQKGSTEYYRTKWAAEERVRGAGIDYTIFRPSLIFGPGDGLTSLLISQYRYAPIIPIIGDGLYRFAPVSIHDVCAAFTQALALDGVTSAKTYELCGPQVLTYLQILDVIAARLESRKPRIHLPVRLMRAIIRLSESLHLPLPITPEQLTMLLQGNVCVENTAAQVFDLPKMTLARGVMEMKNYK